MVGIAGIGYESNWQCQVDLEQLLLEESLYVIDALFVVDGLADVLTPGRSALHLLRHVRRGEPMVLALPP